VSSWRKPKPRDQRELVGLRYLSQPVELRETQLDLLPVVIYQPDPLPVVIVISVNHAEGTDIC
jgi:hypothetical protein